MWPGTVHINCSYYRTNETFLSKTLKNRPYPPLCKSLFQNGKSTFSCKQTPAALPQPWCCSVSIWVVHRVLGRFMCPLPCRVCCTFVLISGDKRAFAENNPRQLLAQHTGLNFLLHSQCNYSPQKCPVGMGNPTDICRTKWKSSICCLCYELLEKPLWFV